MDVFARMRERIFHLAEIFELEKPLEVKKGLSQEVVCLPEGHLIVLDEGTRYSDLSELVATCKLGEREVLLGTLFFQRGLSKEEEKFAGMFANLTYPLRSLWTWKVMFEYLPENEFVLEFNEMLSFLQPLFGKKVAGGGLPLSPFKVVALKLIAEEFSDSSISISGNEEWKTYLSALEELKERVGVESLVELPERVNAPYRVTVEEKPYRHYRVEKKRK